jgi:hypothetical protein
MVINKNFPAGLFWLPVIKSGPHKRNNRKNKLCSLGWSTTRLSIFQTRMVSFYRS